MSRLPRLPALLARLEEVHGAPRRAPPRDALGWLLWENVAYLVDDDARARAFAALARRTGLTAAGILALPPHELLAIARQGMHPEKRAERLRAIAERVRDEFGGDLGSLKELPPERARRALQRFPGIGAPGAEKILLLTGAHPYPALESNGLRVLCRLGLAREAKSYPATYASGQRALAPFAGRGTAFLARAFHLLRRHGQALCKNTRPRCDACPLADGCPSAETD